MLEMIVKLLGCGKLLTTIDAIDGYKRYIAGTCKMFSGLSAMLGGVAAALMCFQGGHGLMSLVDSFKSPCFQAACLTISGGFYAASTGLHDIGQVHADEKAAAQAALPAPQAQPPVAPQQ